jgi:protein involved in polysaccharide export with SLBB domain
LALWLCGMRCDAGAGEPRFPGWVPTAPPLSMATMRVIPLLLLGAPSFVAAQSQVANGSPTTDRLNVPRETRSALPRVDDGVRLAPGDVLRISVWRRPELSGEFVLASDGALTHPLLKAVLVAGTSMPEIERRIRSFLLGFDAEPQFVIEPLVRVTVGGEVLKANVYTLSPQTTVAQAVEIAGGPTERGERRNIRLMRGATEFKIDLARSVDGRASEKIRSGDRIIVLRRRDMFRQYIAPVAAVAGATAAIINAVLYNRRYR